MTANEPNELETRGIARAAKSAGWTVYGEWWKYPVRDLNDEVVAQRGKKRHYKGRGKKCIWFGEFPTDGSASWYHPTRLKEHVAAAEGVLYTVAGEPDLLVFVEAGIYNVASWFGEQNIPPALIEDLRRLGVKRVIYCPDCDKAGYDAAWKLFNLLDPTEITLAFVALNGKFGSGYDINNLWMDVDFLARRFEERIANPLKPLEFFDWAEIDGAWTRPGAKPAPKQRDTLPQVTDTNGDLPPGLVEAIISALGADGGSLDADGWTRKPVRCVFSNHEHDDHKPAAHWNVRANCYFCFKCGAHNAIETAAALNIDTKPFYEAWDRQRGIVPGRRSPAAPPPPPESNRVAPSPVANPIVTSAIDAADRLLVAISKGTGFHVLTYPLPLIHGKGGQAEVTTTGKCSLWIGASGEGKTILTNQMLHQCRLYGYNALLASPEWSPEELLIMEVMTIDPALEYNRILKHIQCKQSPDGCTPTGEKALFSGDQLARFNAALSRVLDMNERARVDYVENAPMGNMLNRLADELDARRSAGQVWNMLFMDYLQVFQDGPPTADDLIRMQDPTKMLFNDENARKNDEESKARQLKNFAERMKVHIVVTTQVNKSDAEAALTAGKVLTSQSAHYVQPYVFNLIGSLNPQYWRDLDFDRKGKPRGSHLRLDDDGLPIPFGVRQTNGELFQFFKLYLTKNNTGEKNVDIMTLRNHRQRLFRGVTESDVMDAYAHYRERFKDEDADEDEQEPIPGLDGKPLPTDVGSFLQKTMPID